MAPSGAVLFSGCVDGKVPGVVVPWAVPCVDEPEFAGGFTEVDDPACPDVLDPTVPLGEAEVPVCPEAEPDVPACPDPDPAAVPA